MLKRKAEKILNEWLKSKDALLITGARQVGKSYLVKKFGKEHFKHFIELNLFDKKELIPVLEQSNNAEELLFRLTAFAGEKMVPGETLIFFDEIQYAKKCDLITMSKFLVEDGRYRFIFSGSMLGVELNNIASWPTGYMREIQMFPLDFEEFLWAVNLNQSVFNHLKDCYENKTPVDEYVHKNLIDAFYKYLLIGGMPEAVQTFIVTNDLNKVNAVHEKINQYYQKDVTQYASIDQRVHLETIYQLIAQELNSKNKRFSLGEIGKGYEIKDIQDDFMWLKKAGVALPVYNVSEPKSPLVLSCNNRLVKLFHADVGVLSYMLMDTDIQMKLFAKEKDVNYGAIFENAVAQELTAHGFRELYYFNSKKQGEVDFLIEYKGNVLPLEVKSGKDFKKHSALYNLLSNREYNIPSAIVLCNGNVDFSDKTLYLPIYMIMLIEKKKSQGGNISLDLSTLKIGD
ncbi:MAG: ATP-binding protein [Christensenellaceae bacterium]